MYLSHFALAEAPFSIAPDPRYLYMSQRHQEALAHLLYGLGGEGGFVLLTGEVGAGKTTVCRCLLEQIPADCDVAYIFNPKLSAGELLATLCSEFGIALPPGPISIKVYIDHINAYLLAAHARGRHTVLIIDEAQNLSAEVLEQMRLLTNLETSQRKLLQIILLGQPELATMLARPELRQLAQRIVARYHLGALGKAEVAAYVSHRLEVAGAKRALFSAALMGRVYQLSGGIPRVINVLCERALLGAYVQGKEKVDRATLAQAAREVFQHAKPRRSLVLPLLGLLLLVAAGAVYQQEIEAAFSPADRLVAAGVPLPLKPQVLPAPVKTAEVVAAAPLPQRLAWPAELPLAQSQTLAEGALFNAWGMNGSGKNPCAFAETRGLRCRSARGGLGELRQLNRPAVLGLQDAQGQTFYATLTALDEESATFALGDETRKVARVALAAQWSGYYMLLWRVPPAGLEMLRPGQSGPAVA